MRTHASSVSLRVVALALAAAACLSPALAGDAVTIRIDGSSTVFPITEAVAEEFQKVNPNIRVTVGISGTGGGFKKFTAAELDIADASRPIKGKEIEAALAGGVAFIELPVAYDGLAILVHPSNDWCKDITVAELKAIWQPGSKVTKWSDVRAGWPAKEIHLYGPGTDSGTFDYFTEAIMGTAKSSRADYTASEDDNMLVQGIAGDPLSLGYFGYAYFEENAERLKLVAVDGGKGAITPSPETVKNGTYSPLSRPLFIYVRKTNRPEIRQFVKFYLENAPELVEDVGYVPLTAAIYQACMRRYDAQTIGSVFKGASEGAKVDLEALYGVRATN